MGNEEASRFRELLAAERRSADLYDGLAEAAHGERREILNQLAAVERRHAEHWAGKLVDLGEPVPEPGSRGSRTRVLSWLARRFSIDAVLPYLERAERSDAGMYQDDPDATSGMAASERSHARVLTQLRGGERDDRDVLRRSEPWHRGDRSGALRAGVFGVNDGLVSNTSLAMGFAGSGASASVILFAGLAGLLAGALSMAAGEYISMRSQREAYQREITLEEQELRDDPEAEAEELALIYRAKVLDAEEAERVATTIMKDREAALDTTAREELGLDPGELGSPWSARPVQSRCVRGGSGCGRPAVPVLVGQDGADRRDRLGQPGPVRRRGGDRCPQRPRRPATVADWWRRGTARLRDRSRRRCPYRRPARRPLTPRTHRQWCCSRTRQGVVAAAVSAHAACAPESPMR